MDNATLDAEKTLLAAIEQLRGQFPQTQDLYREVCALMFFRFGMTPTANKLYQLVRKGSMSAPAEALNRFWENLREKSRVTITHPDLPESLKSAAGQLTATLWKAAQAEAGESVAIFRAEAQTLVEQANAALDAAFKKQKQTQVDLDRAEIQRSASIDEILALKQEVSALKATNLALVGHLDELKAEIVTHHQRADALRKEHLDALDKARAATQLAEERFQAMEARSLLEIDRERTAAAKLQKAVEGERAATAAATERQRIETNALQQNLGELKQKIGTVEAQLRAQGEARDQLAAQLVEAKTQLEGTAANLAYAETELTRLRTLPAPAPKPVKARRVPLKLGASAR